MSFDRKPCEIAPFQIFLQGISFFIIGHIVSVYETIPTCDSACKDCYGLHIRAYATWRGCCLLDSRGLALSSLIRQHVFNTLAFTFHSDLILSLSMPKQWTPQCRVPALTMKICYSINCGRVTRIPARQCRSNAAIYRGFAPAARSPHSCRHAC